MSVYVIDRKGIPVLGTEKRAEQLVDWSIRKPDGSRYTKDFPFGLRISFVSEGFYPKMYIHWNETLFDAYLKSIGMDPERFFLVHYGICVERRNRETLVRLLGAGKTGVVLWDTKNRQFCQKHRQDNVNWLVGMVRFGENGPEFLTEVECQSELEEATALAVIRVDKKFEKPKSAPAVLSRPKISQKAANYLATDAILNAFLAQSQAR